METVKLRVGREELKVVGSQELIERERKAFYSHIEELEEKSAIARGQVIEKLRSQTFAGTSGKERYKGGVLESNNWRDIAKDVKDGKELHVGDMVQSSLTDGTDFTAVVTEVTDAYVRFDSRDCVGKSVYWNRERTNNGGYPASAVCGYIENELWELLPEDLQTVISETTRMYKEADSEEEHTYKAKLFLPAASEVFGEDDCYGDKGVYKQLKYYKDRRNRMKGSAQGEDTCSWWLASVRSGLSTLACIVYGAGHAGYSGASSDLRVPLCFQISKS